MQSLKLILASYPHKATKSSNLTRQKYVTSIQEQRNCSCGQQASNNNCETVKKPNNLPCHNSQICSKIVKCNNLPCHNKKLSNHPRSFSNKLLNLTLNLKSLNIYPLEVKTMNGNENGQKRRKRSRRQQFSNLLCEVGYPAVVGRCRGSRGIGNRDLPRTVGLALPLAVGFYFSTKSKRLWEISNLDRSSSLWIEVRLSLPAVTDSTKVKNEDSLMPLRESFWLVTDRVRKGQIFDDSSSIIELRKLLDRYPTSEPNSFWLKNLFLVALEKLGDSLSQDLRNHQNLDTKSIYSHQTYYARAASPVFESMKRIPMTPRKPVGHQRCRRKVKQFPMFMDDKDKIAQEPKESTSPRSKKPPPITILVEESKKNECLLENKSEFEEGEPEKENESLLEILKSHIEERQETKLETIEKNEEMSSLANETNYFLVENSLCVQESRKKPKENDEERRRLMQFKRNFENAKRKRPLYYGKLGISFSSTLAHINLLFSFNALKLWLPEMFYRFIPVGLLPMFFEKDVLLNYLENHIY
ncbi:hypothetical protein M9H77_23326 [Catharanthus roseus]|uniref:Uncharacterized protein n=1 Tax=Catharanthus roseus TaxID=4058 RepID=A0ACC0ASP1_CATRO|nr:hypothetical protein M9H77_23326 [Catharanthus roseus]